jgi:Uma2 family endonuclease
MSVTIPIKSIELREGSAIALHSLTWQDWENILEELGEDRHTRIAYYQGTLEIMSPLSRHERPHRIIGYIVTAILDVKGEIGKILARQLFIAMVGLALNLILVFMCLIRLWCVIVKNGLMWMFTRPLI